MAQNTAKMGQKWAKNRSKIGHFGVILDQFWVDPGSFWGHLGHREHFGIVLASFWGRFDLVLASFSGRFWCAFDPF